MKFKPFIIYLLIFTSLWVSQFVKARSISWQNNWLNQTNETSKKNLLKILQSSQSGRFIINQAKKKYKKNLLSLIVVADISITDTTLQRSFYPNSSKVLYLEHTIIKINKLLNLKDAVLDLAHELTHYSYRKFFNPYKNNYSIISYVQRTIEGQGGEVDAFLMECNVRKEIFGKQSLLENQCGSIVDGKNSQKFSRLKAVKLFYQMGRYYSKFLTLTDSEDSNYKFANSKNYRFISSAFNLPYPLAAVMEFRAIKSKICKTNKRRINSFLRELRKPASLEKIRRSPSSSVVMNLKDQYKKRCL